MLHQNGFAGEGAEKMTIRLPWASPQGMEKYLRSTELCDSANEDVKKKALDLARGTTTQRQAAVKIFYYVRDGILFALDDLDAKASATLKRGHGSSASKTNLQVALLRAAGIPARYHRSIVSKRYMEGIVSSLAYKRLPDDLWWHCWCECNLAGEWISCDSQFDKALYEALCQKGVVTEEQIPTIDWDGVNDLETVAFWQVDCIGAYDCVDAVLKKTQKQVLHPQTIKRVAFWLSNRHIDKLRRG